MNTMMISRVLATRQRAGGNEAKIRREQQTAIDVHKTTTKPTKSLALCAQSKSAKVIICARGREYNEG